MRSTLIVCCTPSRFETMLRWLSITPLGVPVLPLEKITVASESSLTSRGIRTRRKITVGTTRAIAAQTSLFSLVKRRATSSTITIPGCFSMPSRVRSFSVVKIVLIPVRSIATLMASFEAV